MTTSSAAADKDNEQAHVQDVRARYEALLPKYGNLWRSMAPKITPQNRQPLSLLPAIENGQAISLRVPSNQCDCPFDSCQDCVEPIVEIDNDGGRDGSSESSEDSGSSQDSAPICFDLSNLRIEDSDGTDNRNKGENRSKKSELIMSPEPEPFRDAASADESLAIKSSQDESLCSSSSSSTNISNGTEQVGWDLSFLRIEDDNESLSGKNAVKKTIDDDIESDADSFANERRWLADRAKEEKESQSQTISLLDDSDSDMESYDKKLPAANNKTERKMEKRQRVVFASDESSSEEEWDEGKELNVKNEPRDEPKRELNRSPTVIVLSDSDDDDGNDSWHDANDVLDDDDESLDESIKEKFAKRVPKAKDTSLSSYAIPTKKNKSKGLSKTAFRKNRQEIADRAFAEFDRVAFGGALLDVELVWSNKLRTTAGITRLKQISGGGKPTKRIATIELSTKIIDEEHRLRATLLHELCHAAAWLVDGVSKPPHGKCFKKWANIAMKKVRAAERICEFVHSLAILAPLFRSVLTFAPINLFVYHRYQT